MEKTVTINGKVVRRDPVTRASIDRLMETRRNHVKTWSDIYQEVRRQWVEAEQGRTERYRCGK